MTTNNVSVSSVSSNDDISVAPIEQAYWHACKAVNEILKVIGAFILKPEHRRDDLPNNQW